MFRRINYALAYCLISIGALGLPTTVSAGSKSNFTLFESGQVRPLALSADRGRLFALNTPDNRLEIFKVGDQRLTPVGSVPVGLEPVALAVRNDKEVWVVNHLSDSISIVSLDDNGGGRVTRTLQVGDEPRDIVFARSLSDLKANSPFGNLVR
ncbi:YncE family protein [Methylomonas sp. MS20]|uniref:YncE family protein n=1 Tax=Methylomonas sp. MS20 TaxID=3418769 RepID=UPI003D053458